MRKAANYTLYVSVLSDEEQSRNRLNAGGSSKSLVFVYINLQHFDTAIILVGKSLQHRGECLTRATPSGIEIDDNWRDACIVVPSEVLLIIFDILHNRFNFLMS